MKVGLPEAFKETPLLIRRIRSAIVYTLAGSLPFAEIIAPKLGIDILHYGSYVGLAMLVTKGISSIFGVDPEDDKKSN